MEDFVCGIEALQTGEELHFRNLDLTFHVGYLASITEKFFRSADGYGSGWGNCAGIGKDQYHGYGV